MSHLWNELTFIIKTCWVYSPLYFFSLWGKHPRQLSISIPDPWPGNSFHGRKLMDGYIIHQDKSILLSELWHPDFVDTDYLHQFEWLRDLRAIGDNSARRLCRQLIVNWIQRNKNFRAKTWSPSILGSRLSHFISLADFFCISADEEFQKLFFKSILKQYRHLKATYLFSKDLFDMLVALKGLILTAIAFTEERHRLTKYLKKYETILEKQLCEDGGHISRSPAVQLRLLKDLIDIRAALRVIAFNDVETIQTMIEKIAPIVRLLRHGDGELADFGHHDLIPANVVDMALSLADVRGRPPLSAAKTGFERGAARQALLLLNTGNPIKTHLSDGTGLMNYEWSLGKNRIILQGDILLQTHEGHFIQAPVQKSPISMNRHEEEGHVFLDGAYDINNQYGDFTHHRQLYLNSQASGLKGQDSISSTEKIFCAIRFLVNPAYESKLAKNGKGALIHLSDTKTIRFLASGCHEIYWDEIDCKSRKSNKASAIMLLASIPPNKTTTIKWAFHEDL